MKLIVGLGNPGQKYEKTRHNIGFMVLDMFLKNFQKANETNWSEETKFKSSIAKIDWQPKKGSLEKVVLAKPKTYMNNSGLSVSLISQYLNISISDVWIVHDDIDLALGSLRIRFGGSSAGHNGLESIIEKLGTDKFWRFRLGVGRPGVNSNNKYEAPHKDIENHVLQGFGGGEWGKARQLIKKGAKALEAALEEGLEKAMNQYNTR